MSKPKFVDPALIQAQLMEGLAFQQNGRLEDAQAAYKRILRVQPKHFDALHLLGVIAAQQKDFAKAIELISAAIKVNPANAAAHYNLGYALEDLGRYQAAVIAYDKAIKLKPDHFVAYNNRGVALSNLTRHADAVESFDASLRLNPSCAEAHYNRGVALSNLHREDEAAESFDAALRLNPDYDDARGLKLYAQAGSCNWNGFEAGVAEVAARLSRGEKASPPWPTLVLLDAPALQRKAAALSMAERYPVASTLRFNVSPRPTRKIRVGYFSMDFRDHPVSTLMAGVLEAHNRDAFEVYGFSYGPDTQDAMRARIKKACDTFLDVKDRTNQDIATLARARKIDIAVDLAGHTTHARTGIFALRAAPIQATYIGYPGTMGADFIDYIVADSTVIPAESQMHYTEKIVTLPNFQANDRSREIAQKEFTRAELGLPATGFVFCCFNNTFKILPRVFESWMNILKKVPGSVLFLYADTKKAASNLKKEATARGVDAERLVFGERVSMPEYLARLRAMDIFLDTLPFNAGTTASDALWAGLPVLTRTGETFAGRMAASLLRTLDLPELITATQSEYEDLAVALADDPARLSEIKQKLDRQRLASPLFNVAVFTSHLEDAYRQMTARHYAGLAPDHIYVKI